MVLPRPHWKFVAELATDPKLWTSKLMPLLPAHLQKEDYVQGSTTGEEITEVILGSAQTATNTHNWTLQCPAVTSPFTIQNGYLVWITRPRTLRLSCIRAYSALEAVLLPLLKHNLKKKKTVLPSCIFSCRFSRLGVEKHFPHPSLLHLGTK